MINDKDLSRWLEAYGAAWVNKDPAAAAALFTEDASYQETPYAEPFKGRAGIAEYWATVTKDQVDIDFTYQVLATSGNTGFAQWSARFRLASENARVELNGIFVLEFADTTHVSSLREWWHVR